jgi:hypothetical protein
MSILASFSERGLVTFPPYLLGNLQYEVLMGSHAFATNDAESDQDVFAVCITPDEKIKWQWEVMQDRRFPVFEHLEAGGEPLRGNKIGADLVVDSLYNFVARCYEGKPMAIEMLFVHSDNIQLITAAGQMLRDKRHIFLCRSAAREFLDFGERQLKGMVTRSYQPDVRQKYVDKFGYDTKAGYHSVRLVEEAKQMLVEGDLDLQRHREMLLEIRRGEWPEEKLVAYFRQQAAVVESLLDTSHLRETTDGGALDELLENFVTAATVVAIDPPTSN